MPKNGKTLVVHEGDTVLVIETRPGTDQVLPHSKAFPIVARTNGRAVPSAVIGKKIGDRVDTDPYDKGRTVVRAMSFVILEITPNPLVVPKRPIPAFATTEAGAQQ
jgi:hypothetical protein